jgi:alanyl-tRNA synthetase
MASFILNNSDKLPPTQKLWIDDPYRTECTATVLYTQDDLLITDQTIFYAESGGQVPDIGSINGVKVVDVQKQPGRIVHIHREDVNVPFVQVDTVVVHKLECLSPFNIGEQVQMNIDWEHRYNVMRYHSAAHFVFHAIDKIYGATDKLYLKGCYIYDQSARFDYANKLNPELIQEISALSNDLISRCGDILMEPDASTRDISYWKYEDIIIPCGGTHVHNAQEIGSVSVRRKSHGKKLNRIYLSLQDSG